VRAYLAVRRLKGAPITFPIATGAPQPLVGGVIALPD
jgi:anhydro-N-acetylmuramic acid kinase